MSKFKSIISTIFIILFVYGGYVFYQGWNGVAGGKDTKIVVQEGQGKNDLAKILKQKNLVKSDTLFALRLASSNIVIRPGEYDIEGGKTPSQIAEKIAKTSQEIYEKGQKKNVRKVVKITVPEGKTADEIIEILNQAGLKNSQKLAKYWTKKQVDLKYDFLPTEKNCEYGDVNKCIKYYYEGYLYPNTYEFYEDASEKEISKVFLDGFEKEIYEKIGRGKNSEELFKILNVAAMVEKETGRPKGVNATNIVELNRERDTVARVLYNRIDAGMKIQSDPTVTYGLDKKVCQQGRNITGCIFLNDPLVLQNKYNTYEITGLPIGPITSPHFNSIKASINPPENDYLFFVADINGKKYFAKTNQEHENNIAKVKAINNAQ